MRLAYVAAGAAGMYCGSCIHDNTLATALQQEGVEVALLPTYTPLRTDEVDVSGDRIFYGGINVYLQQKSSFFHRTPRILDRILDSPKLLNLLSRFAASTNPADLGALTVSVLKGEQGGQQRELVKLVSWLAREFRPDLVQLTNSMFLGLAGPIKREVGVPVLCSLQGEDVFLDGLPEPHRTQALDELRLRAGDVDGFVAPNRAYAEKMTKYLQISDNQVHVVPLGLNLSGHGHLPDVEKPAEFTIGYLARICPDKGFHLLTEAFHALSLEAEQPVRLEVAGYLGRGDRAYFQRELKRIREWGLDGRFRYWGEVDRAQKIRFLNQIHVFSVPTTRAEAKGLFVLEALANGTPVVLPDHGSFPELLAATGGGILVDTASVEALTRGLQQLREDAPKRARMGREAMENVHRTFSARQTARAALAVYEMYGKGGAE